MMLGALRTQLTALSLRSASTTNGLCMRLTTAKTGSVWGAQYPFSTAATDATNAGAEEDATAAFLDATEPGDMRVVSTMKKNIRYSPRKLTYLAQQIRGLSAKEAILQMKFSPKRKAEIVRKTVQNAINLADIKHQIEPENLQVAECFVNKGHYLKRLRIMGRGRSGIMHHPHSHLTVTLREFDPAKKPLNRFRAKKAAREVGDAKAEESA